MKKLTVATLANVMLALIMSASAHAARIIDTESAAQILSRGAIVWDIREAEASTRAIFPAQSTSVSGSARSCARP